jgi:DsbC/DsbD-like thiol-disulfide interchange protein
MLQATRIPLRTLIAMIAAVSFLAVLLASPNARAGGKASDSKVKIKAASQKGSDGATLVKLNLSIEKGWYIYANPVGNDDLASNATVVTVKGVKDSDLKVLFPKPKTKVDKTIGNYNYYDGDVTIEATVRNASGPLEFHVQVNSCNFERGVCLAPGTVKVTVP